MELHIDKAPLSEESVWVSRIINPRPTNPILNAILIEADGEDVVMSASGQDATSRTQMRATVQEPGRVAVNGRLLAEISRSLPNRPVTIKEDGNRLDITCGRSKFRLPLMPAADYPVLPEDPERFGSISGDSIGEAASQTVFAAAKDETLPVLAAVNIIFKEGEAVFAATDRYRLAVKTVPWEGEALADPVLLRAKTLGEIARSSGLLRTELAIDSKGAVFGASSGGRRSTMPIMEGTFPDYERLLPTSGTTTAQTDVSELLEAVKRVRIVADRPNIPLRLKFGNDELLLSVGDGVEAGANEPVDCSIEGDATTIAFNPEYLIEALSAMRNGNVRFLLNGPQRSALLSSPEDPSYRHLMMPVRLES